MGAAKITIDYRGGKIKVISTDTGEILKDYPANIEDYLTLWSLLEQQEKNNTPEKGILHS